MPTIGELTPDPANRRKHNPRNIGMLVDAMHAVGAARSIVIDEDGVVLAGNGVLEAAAEAGITNMQIVDADGETVIAVRRSNLSEAQKRALAIFDNRTAELAEWNIEQLQADAAAGLDLQPYWTADEQSILLRGSKAGRTDPDAVPEIRATTIARGDLFQLGSHRLLCGDATDAADVARVMDGAQADCVFTSPPYGVGVDYGGTYVDSIANLRALLPRLAAVWHTAIVAGGFAVINFGDIVSARDLVGSVEPCEYPMALEYWPIFRAAGWLLWSRRIWCKPGARTRSMQCIGSNRAATNWEHVWTWKRPGDPVVAVQIAGPNASQFGWRDTSAEHAPDVGQDVHAAGMPVAPVLWLVPIHARARAHVHEPFCGTGTTIIGCEQLDRCCHAIDINPSYVQVTIDRWEAFTGHRAERIGAATQATA